MSVAGGERRGAVCHPAWCGAGSSGEPVAGEG